MPIPVEHIVPSAPVASAPDLFRPQALEAASTPLGEILLARPLALSVLAALGVAAVLALLAWLWWGQHARKARAVGLLVPQHGVVRIVAPVPGVVTEAPAVQGALVPAGSTLFVISLERASAREPATQAAIARSLERQRQSLLAERRLRDRLAAARRAALASRIGTLQAETAEAGYELAAQRERVTLAHRSAARIEALRERGFVSEAAAQLQAEATLEQRIRAHGMERSRLAATRELEALSREAQELSVRQRLEEAELERSLAALEQSQAENAARASALVSAPQAGTVAALLVQAGQSVPAGATLAVLVPRGSPLVAQLLLPSRAAGFVRPGQPVALRYPAFPFQKFGHHRGTVLAVSGAPVVPAELPWPVTGLDSEPVYRVEVVLPDQGIPAYGRVEPLKAGMAVEADVELERRRLFEWLLEPLLSVRGRL